MLTWSEESKGIWLGAPAQRVLRAFNLRHGLLLRTEGLLLVGDSARARALAWKHLGAISIDNKEVAESPIENSLTISTGNFLAQVLAVLSTDHRSSVTRCVLNDRSRATEHVLWLHGVPSAQEARTILDSMKQAASEKPVVVDAPLAERLNSWLSEPPEHRSEIANQLRG